LFDGPDLRARGVSLRWACREDAAFLRELFETARPDAAVLAAWPEGARRPFLDQQFQFQCVHYARVYPAADQLVIAHADERIGRLTLDRAPNGWCLVDIALLPAWRGRGVGTLLLQRIQSAAVRAAVPHLCLSVDVRNPARRLYARLGFIATEDEDGMANIEMAYRAAAVS
jgi:GNAT superfamily N-acetyltransferase